MKTMPSTARKIENTIDHARIDESKDRRKPSEQETEIHSRKVRMVRGW